MRLQQGLFIIFFGGLLSFSCSSPDSASYRSEEIAVYRDVLPDLLKPIVKFTPDGRRSIFFMFDSLSEFDNTKTETNLLKIKLERRQFKIDDIPVANCRFLKATKYPQDSILASGDLLEIIPGKSKQYKDEFFTHHWITLSRVCFNESMTNGFFETYIWCGNLCSSYDGYDIQKVRGRWTIIKRYRGPVS